MATQQILRPNQTTITIANAPLSLSSTTDTFVELQLSDGARALSIHNQSCVAKQHKVVFWMPTFKMMRFPSKTLQRSLRWNINGLRHLLQVLNLNTTKTQPVQFIVLMQRRQMNLEMYYFLSRPQ